MRAVLPEPTGLFKSASRLIWKLSRTQDAKNIPSNANGKGPLLPIAALDQRHLPSRVAPRPVEYLMRVSMVDGCPAMRVWRAIMCVAVRHVALKLQFLEADYSRVQAM